MPPRSRNIYNSIGDRIRQLRTAWEGSGISQEELAAAIGATANTISRWETATYKLSIADLDKLAQFFHAPIAAFFPDVQPPSQIDALLTAARGLDDDELEEVKLYALFRRARQSKSRK